MYNHKGVEDAVETKVLLLSVLMVSIARAGAGQSGLPEARQQGAAGSSSSSPSKSGKVSASGCLSNDFGKLRLTDAHGNIYYLIANTAELRHHIGSEVEVIGTQDHPPMPSVATQEVPATTLSVMEWKLLPNPTAEGLQPAVGNLADWVSYFNKTYGITIRAPRTFTTLNDSASCYPLNFVENERVARLLSLVIPSEVFPHTNFTGGGFTVFVNPRIQSEGTCKQFGQFWPLHTLPRVVQGIPYTQTLFTGAATGNRLARYSLHTFQNGVCYEFVVGVGTVSPGSLEVPCSVRAIGEKNELEMMDTLLSGVTFVAAQFKRQPGENAPRPRFPVVRSFTATPISSQYVDTVAVSWSTDGADYVQLHYPCTDRLYVSGAESSSMKCGTLPDRDFPPKGSTTLMLQNLNEFRVRLELSVEPFSDGVGYPKQSKTIAIRVTPRPAK